MEKLDYFLFLKQKYSDILAHLIEINNLYREIINNDIVNNEIILKSSHTSELHLYESQITKVTLLLENISNKIQNNCQHNFVNDEIDITPDKSICITYCSICEKTI